MRPLTQQQRELLMAQVASLESKTDAELVLLVCNRSDSYLYIPALWAALVALLSGACLLAFPVWITPSEVVLVQLVIFLLLAGVFRFEIVLSKIIPKKAKTWRCANFCRRQFLEQNLHVTKGRNGILLFVSLQERYVEVLGDLGVVSAAPEGMWQAIVQECSKHLKKGDLFSCFQDAVNAIARDIAPSIPLTEAKNELPNHVIEIRV